VNELLRRRMIWFVHLLLLSQWVTHSQAQDLIQPAPDMPTYTLGSINQGTDAFGRPAITVDYKRTKEGIGVVMLSGCTSDGPLKIMGSGVLLEESGKLQLSDLFVGTKGLDGELYLVVSGSFAEECEFACLVSNVARIGNPATATATAREWNTRESTSYQKELVGRKPPLGVPDGYQLVRASTKLIAGMPVKVGRYGKWVDAEALTSEAAVTVKISGGSNLRILTRDGWIAVDPTVLQKGTASTSSFKPSVKLIPGTTTVLPEGFVVVTEAMKLVPGTPVRAIWFNQLLDATVISVDGKLVLTHCDSKPSSFDKTCPLVEVVIAETTIEELANPDATERFKDRVPKRSSIDEEMDKRRREIEEDSKRIQAMVDRNIEDARHGMASSRNPAGLGGLPTHPLALQNNPIEIPIPREAELLPLDFPIPRGTKLAVCWARRWNYVTVLKDNTDDEVPIHWDDRTSDFDGIIHRTQLIIRKSDLKKLRIKATRSEKRVWTDSTGKHTVEATLSSRTSTQITIRKEDGKEVTLSIDKLSAADQKWLRENP
jgi:hypothetical protein